MIWDWTHHVSAWRESQSLDGRITFDFCAQSALLFLLFALFEWSLASPWASALLLLVAVVLTGLCLALLRGWPPDQVATGFVGLVFAAASSLIAFSGGQSVATLLILPVFVFLVVLLQDGWRLWCWAAAILLLPLLAVLLLQVQATFPIQLPPEWRQDSILGATLVLILFSLLVGRAFRITIQDAQTEADHRANLWRQEGDAARLNEERFRDFASEAANILWETDADRRITFLSHGFETLFEISIDDALGLRTGDFYRQFGVEQEEPKRHKQLIEEHLPFRNQRLIWPLRDGRRLTVLNSGRPAYGPLGEFLGYRGVIRDITETMNFREKLQEQANRDALSGLLNRRAFMNRLSTALARAVVDRKALALAFVDLDHFKDVNDRGGHSVGDDLLRGIAKVLAGTAGDSAELARFGGDEFCIIWFRPQPTALRKLGEDLVQAVSGFKLLRGGAGFGVGCSIGIAWQQPVTEVDVDEWLRCADASAYAAKESGRGRVELVEVASPMERPKP